MGGTQGPPPGPPGPLSPTVLAVPTERWWNASRTSVRTRPAVPSSFQALGRSSRLVRGTVARDSGSFWGGSQNGGWGWGQDVSALAGETGGGILTDLGGTGSILVPAGWNWGYLYPSRGGLGVALSNLGG